MFGSGYENCLVLFLSSIFCKQEEKLLFFGSVSGCTCLILLLPLTLPKRERNILKVHWTKDLYTILYINPWLNTSSFWSRDVTILVKNLLLLYLRKTFNIMKIIFRCMPGMTYKKKSIYTFVYIFFYLFIILQFSIIFFIYCNIKTSIFLLEVWEGFEEHLMWKALFKCIYLQSWPICSSWQLGQRHPLHCQGTQRIIPRYRECYLQM
jgi:hypothetical protein